MIKNLRFLLLVSFFLLTVNVYAGGSPVGYWQATSPFYFGHPLAIVKTYMMGDKLCGQIVKVIPVNGSFAEGGNGMASSGPVMMCGYHLENGVWVDGQIYEQITARLYPSEITISDGGRYMTVKAWRGPFSRTSRWERIK